MNRDEKRLATSLSLTSKGARVQFAVAMALLSLIPLLVVIYLCLSGWLGFQVPVDQLWPMVAMVLPFMALGYWMLAKYPINIVRLRHYLENLANGTSPGHVALVTNEDDLASIETLMRKVVQQAEERVRIINTQNGVLMVAERQRVMIQSLGAACHHLGQPATLLIGHLELLRRLELPAEARARLLDCQTAAEDVANILHRLQSLTEYRTEPYMVQTEADPNSSESCRIVKV